MIGSFVEFQRMLGGFANVHTGGGSPQEPPLHERNQDGVARLGVETPESPRLGFGKFQPRHFVVLALDALNQRAAQLLFSGR